MTPRNGVGVLVRQRHLVWALAKREIFERYAGQMLGAVWAFAHPLVLMGVYIFIFGFVFRVRIGGTPDLPLDYTAYLLAGIVPWLALAEGLQKATVAVTSNASLVKQVVFPVEVLPAKTVLASMLAQVTGFAVLIGYVLYTRGSLPATYSLLPLVMAMQFVLTVGLAMILSAVGVFIRDLKDIVQILTIIGIYLLPVLYLPAMVPDLFRPLLYLNPFTYLIWCYQDVCYFGRFEHPSAWIVTFVLCILMFAIGWRLFQRVRPMFGNAL
jgi:lipopolysaccharide transport system permease protein